MKADEFRVIYTELCSMFSKDIEPVKANGYWNKFKEYDTSLFKNACVKSIDQCEFFPTVAKLKQLMKPEVPSIEEVKSSIMIIMKIARNGSWSSKDYHPIVSQIIKSSSIAHLGGLSEYEYNKTIKNQYSMFSSEKVQESLNVTNQLEVNTFKRLARGIIK